MADITIKFTGDDMSGSGGGGGSANTYLISVLQKLNATLDKLSANTATSKAKDSLFNSERSSQPFKQSSQDMNKAVQEFNYAADKALKDLGIKIGSVLGASIVAAATISTIRGWNNDANALMAKSTASGQFMASAINGGANNSFGGYISSLYDAERQKQKTQNEIKYEGWMGTAGAVAGMTAAAVATVATDGLAAPSVGGLASAGAGLGAAYGKKEATEKINQYLEKHMILQGAEAARAANASVSEYQTSFSRWGNSMSNRNLMSFGSPITVPLSNEFERRYGRSQNYNSILENIAPYMNQNPLSSQVGDLDQVAQKFIKAGYAASDFSRLTIQSSQYQALTGKNINSFADEVVNARFKFGKAFDSGTMQTSLNLMSLGYNKDRAQSIAYQSQFNPGMSGSINRWANQGLTEYYRNRALSPSVGFDINRSLAEGHLVGASAESRQGLKQDLEDYKNNKPLSSRMSVLLNNGFTYASLQSLLQPKALENQGKNKDFGKDVDQSPAQKAANNEIAKDIVDAIQHGLSNINSLMVNAQNVIINSKDQSWLSKTWDKAGKSFNHTVEKIEKTGSFANPMGGGVLPIYSGSNSPAKK